MRFGRSNTAFGLGRLTFAVKLQCYLRIISPKDIVYEGPHGPSNLSFVLASSKLSCFMNLLASPLARPLPWPPQGAARLRL
jgi:hypothetical protein